MYKYANIKGFYGLPDLELGSEENPLPRLNMVVGTNSTGKTALLKLLYAFLRTAQEERMVQLSEEHNYISVFNRKIRDLFFPRYLNTSFLVSYDKFDASFSISFSNQFSQREISIAWTLNEGRGLIGTHRKNWSDSEILEGVNSIFIPAKEVLSIIDSIALSREHYQLPEFDDSYYDLVKALRVPPPYVEHRESALKDELDSIFEGSINHDRDGARAKFVYQKDGQEYGMAHTAEGIKKIGMLSLLLANGMIDKHTVLFIDEPETALHPEAQRKLIDFLAKLSNVLGIQIFMATHSYYVVNQLANVALEYNTSVKCVSLEPGTEAGYKVYDLLDGMPHIPIMEEALAMQHQNLKLALAQK